MTSRWFKMAETIFLDRRLQKLPASLFRTWANLLAVASWSGGKLPDLADVAFLLRTSPAALARRLDALRTAGLIAVTDDGEVVILGGVETGDRAHDDRPAPMTAAERQRAWRERRRGERVTTPVTPTVTGETPLEIEKREDQTPRDARDVSDDSSFDQFISAFPVRDEPTPRAPTLAAWRKAVAEGADPVDLIAAAKRYAASTAGRERRFVASACRWLGEGRWKDDRPSRLGSDKEPSAPEASGFWIPAGSPEWSAWEAYRGKSFPIDARGGWRVPSLTPPAVEVAA